MENSIERIGMAQWFVGKAPGIITTIGLGSCVGVTLYDPITKIGGMLRTNKIKRIIFASVDKSPHCVQIHYIQDELQKMMNLSNVIIENYVVVNNELIKIVPEIISLSKNLKELSELRNKVGDKNE